MPDPKCTPGQVLNDSQEVVLSKGFSKRSRNVTRQMQRECLARYGVLSAKPGEYECDHAKPVCADGASTLANLWAQPANPRPGFHEKDRVEEFACRQMRAGKLTLPQVQDFVAHWPEHLERVGTKWKVKP